MIIDNYHSLNYLRRSHDISSMVHRYNNSSSLLYFLAHYFVVYYIGIYHIGNQNLFAIALFNENLCGDMSTKGQIYTHIDRKSEDYYSLMKWAR